MLGTANPILFHSLTNFYRKIETKQNPATLVSKSDSKKKFPVNLFIGRLAYFLLQIEGAVSKIITLFYHKNQKKKKIGKKEFIPHAP